MPLGSQVHGSGEFCGGPITFKFNDLRQKFISLEKNIYLLEHTCWKQRTSEGSVATVTKQKYPMTMFQVTQTTVPSFLISQQR